MKKINWTAEEAAVRRAIKAWDKFDIDLYLRFLGERHEYYENELKELKAKYPHHVTSR